MTRFLLLYGKIRRIRNLSEQDDLITKMYDELAHEKEASMIAEVMSEKIRWQELRAY